jgi:hypothetical protein
MSGGLLPPAIGVRPIGAEKGKGFKLTNDPRIAVIGHFFRKSSLRRISSVVDVTSCSNTSPGIDTGSWKQSLVSLGFVRCAGGGRTPFAKRFARTCGIPGLGPRGPISKFCWRHRGQFSQGKASANRTLGQRFC